MGQPGPTAPECPHLALLNHIPERDRAVVQGPDRQRLAIGRERRGGVSIAVRRREREHGTLRPRLLIPHDDPLARWPDLAQCHRLAVGRDGHLSHVVRAGGDGLRRKLLPGRHVPGLPARGERRQRSQVGDEDRTGVEGGAVRRELQRRDRLDRGTEAERRLPRHFSDVPERDRPIGRADGQRLAVGGERQVKRMAIVGQRPSGRDHRRVGPNPPEPRRRQQREQQQDDRPQRDRPAPAT